MSKPFSSTYKKLKNFSSAYYTEALGGKPEQVPCSVAVYLDERGNTSMVVAVPEYIPLLCGTSFVLDTLQPVTIERDEKTGTHFIRSDCNLEVMQKLYGAVMRHYYHKAMSVAKRKVIAYAIACSARDSNGKTVSLGQPSFSELAGHTIGFTYEVLWLVGESLYRFTEPGMLGRAPDAPDDSETARLEICHSLRDLSGKNVIDWSPEAEEACRAFEQSIAGVGQRLYDYFAQPAAELKLALESRVNPLLPPPAN